MPESFSDTLLRPSLVPEKLPIVSQPKKEQRALHELATRAKKEHAQQRFPNTEQGPIKPTNEISASQNIDAKIQNEKQTSLPAPTKLEQATKRAWWKDLISKPIPLPKRIVEWIIDDYHKAFPYVFGDHPVRPSITYEHSLYFPPFAVLDVKVPEESFSKKYALFNEFITQEVSELAAEKRPLVGKLLGLSARLTGALSYRIVYFRDLARWKKVEQTLDHAYGKVERKRLVHRAYFLEGKELSLLEEKAKTAGCPIDEAYRPIKETKGSIADDSFWQQFPGKWKDVVARIFAGAAAHIGKVTDVSLFNFIGIINLNALYAGLLMFAFKLPVLATIATSPIPALLAMNLGVAGATSVGIMYHEMGHQMTKSMIVANTPTLTKS